jgi:hypothetical protein
MKYIVTLVLLSLVTNTGISQNVGIGTTTPARSLHVHSTSTAVQRISSSAPNAEIEFVASGLTRGFVGYYNSTMEIAGTGGVPITFTTNNNLRMTITDAGNVGIGPSPGIGEKLVIQSGNIQLLNTEKGIMLNTADRAMITRGWDVFTSGIHNGLGRWGMFMEPSRLTLGIPAGIGGKAVEVASFNDNSTRNTLLTIDDAGTVKRPAQGTSDLLPICMGSIGNFGTILGGTGNFTVGYDGVNGLLDINIIGHTFNQSQYVAVVTTVGIPGGSRAFASIDEISGLMRIRRYTDGGVATNANVMFVVYKLFEKK